MIGRDGAPGQGGQVGGGCRRFHQLPQFLGCLRPPDGASGYHYGPLGLRKQPGRFLHQSWITVGSGLGSILGGKYDISLIHLPLAYVRGDLHKDGARFWADGLAEGNTHIFGNPLRLHNPPRPFGDGPHVFDMAQFLRRPHVHLRYRIAATNDDERA